MISEEWKYTKEYSFLVLVIAMFLHIKLSSFVKLHVCVGQGSVTKALCEMIKRFKRSFIKETRIMHYQSEL